MGGVEGVGFNQYNLLNYIGQTGQVRRSDVC